MAAFGCRSLSILLSTLAVGALAANAAAQAWGAQFSSPGDDTILAIAPDGQGGTFSAGVTYHDLFAPNPGSDDVIVVRLDADGSPVWAHQIGTAGSDIAVGIAPDGAGGLFVAGSTTGSFTTSAGLRDGLLTRWDAQGNLLWAVNAGTAGWDTLEAVLRDGAGGAIAIGKTKEPNASAYKLWIVRFDGSGTVQGTAAYTDFGNVEPRSAVADGTNGFYVGGWVELGLPPPWGDTDGFVARFTHAGVLQWSRALATSEADSVSGVALDAAGGVFAAGGTSGALGVPQGVLGVSDPFVARFDASGNQVWLRQFGTIHGDGAWSAASDGVGGVVLAGATNGSLAGPSGGKVDSWVMRFDGTGIATWGQQIGTAENETTFSVCSVSSSGIVVGGSTLGDLFGTNPSLSNDAWIAGFKDCAFEPTASYCVASPNSTGQGATIAYLGSLGFLQNDFTLNVAGCPTGQIGLFLLAPGQASIPFGDGVLCLGGGVSRLHPAQVTDISGAASLALDFADPGSNASKITAGSTWNFQFWYRDIAAGGAGFNLSNGLSATFCP
jgi:hypothetical protein